MFDQATLIALGFALIVAGFIITFFSALLLFLRGVRVQGKTRGGGLIMIGPLPIVFGTDKETVKILLVLSVALMILAIVILWLPHTFG